MPTKILVLETPSFQLGANAGPTAEKIDPAAFPARVQQHNASGTKDLLFVLAPEELRYQAMFAESCVGPASVSVAFFPKTEDAIRFLPSIFLFASDTRSLGIKDQLQKGSTIYTENVFNGKGVGARLDPVFAFARKNLTTLSATNAWGSIQSLVFHGLQNLPEQGEKGNGEKIDVQVGADEKVFTLTVRFDLPADRAASARANPLVALPRSASGVFESRYVADGKKIEFNCIFFRDRGPARPIEIQSFVGTTALEKAEAVADYGFKSFAAMDGATVVEKVVAPSKSGFKKKFSAQLADKAEAEKASVISADNAPYKDGKRSSGSAIGDDAVLVTGNVKIDEHATLVTGDYREKDVSRLVKGKAALAEGSTLVKSHEQGGLAESTTIVKGSNAGGPGLAQSTTIVSGNASMGGLKESTTVTGNAAMGGLKETTVVSGNPAGNGGLANATTVVSSDVKYGERETIFKGGATVAELEQFARGQEITIQQKEAMIAKLQKDLAALNDPAAKRDVITNIKDTQTEGLKQNVKLLEAELDEAKAREKELMKMVDKAVQMKDEAAKKIKELELKVKQSGGTKGSKEQMLEKQLEEAKRQNKELAARLGEMMQKQRGGKAA